MGRFRPNRLGRTFSSPPDAARSAVLTNAGATEVNISARFGRTYIRMTVEDNGQGFEMPEAITDFASDGSFGVMGLQERAQLFGGEVVVKSVPGQGTIVRMVMPRHSSLTQLSLDEASPPARTKTPKQPLVVDKV